MIELTSQPLQIADVIAAAVHPAAGGMNVFVGTVRAFNSKARKKVIRLEYDAYVPMALAEIQKIAQHATAEFGIRQLAISHRTGIVHPGEAAVIIAVSTEHRKECFAACQFIIDRIKETAPIWKKEIFEDGAEWVAAHP